MFLTYPTYHPKAKYHKSRFLLAEFLSNSGGSTPPATQNNLITEDSNNIVDEFGNQMVDEN